MEIKSTKEIVGDEIEKVNIDIPLEDALQVYKFAVNNKKWVSIDSLKREMQKIIADEKSRCGEANAVACWVILKGKLK